MDKGPLNLRKEDCFVRMDEFFWGILEKKTEEIDQQNAI